MITYCLQGGIYTVGFSSFHRRNIITVKDSLRHCLYTCNPEGTCETLQKLFFPQKHEYSPQSSLTNFRRANCPELFVC